MKNLKLGLLLILLGIFSNGFSQLNDFDLSNFKLPDLERYRLDTRFYLSGSNNYEKYRSPIQDRESHGGNQFSGDLFFDYNHYLNNLKFQKETNIKLDFGSQFFSRKEDNELQYRNWLINPILNFEKVTRKYYNDLFFIEVDLLTNYQYLNRRNISWDNVDRIKMKDKIQSHTFVAYAPLKIGKGRIEQVQDARHAIYLFNELSKVERVTSSKSEKEIIEFAEFIAQLKNKRFFDSRLRKIAEIESLDSFLIANNYVTERDAKYFTTLNDFWEYGDRITRNSGTRISGTLSPGYYFYSINSPGDGRYYSETDQYLNALLLDGGVEFKHEKPLNLFWQNTIDIHCYGGIIEGKSNDITNSVNNTVRIPNIQLGLNQTIGYYPNTRSDYSIGYAVHYVQLFDQSDLVDEIIGADAKGVRASTNLSFNYYISPKLKLSVFSSLYYNWQDSPDEVILNFDNIAGSEYLLNDYSSSNYFSSWDFKEKELRHYFHISLKYSIF